MVGYMIPNATTAVISWLIPNVVKNNFGTKPNLNIKKAERYKNKDFRNEETSPENKTFIFILK